jgi:hypothetical protein
MSARQRRSAAVQLGAVSTMATLFLSGCGFGGNDYDRYCVDSATGNRINDDDCDDDSSGSSSKKKGSWYYIPSGKAKPAIGAKGDTGGSYSAPSKGGFGKSGGSGSSGG